MPDSVWILSCGNRDGVADDVIEALRVGGRRVVVVRDLPAACLERDVLFCLSDDERVEIVCHRPRAVRALLESCGRFVLHIENV